jgi:hypothetical protein
LIAFREASLFTLVLLFLQALLAVGEAEAFQLGFPGTSLSIPLESAQRGANMADSNLADLGKRLFLGILPG